MGHFVGPTMIVKEIDKLLFIAALLSMLLNCVKLFETLNLIPPALPIPFHISPQMTMRHAFFAGVGIIAGISALLLRSSILLIASFGFSISNSAVGLAVMVSLLSLALGKLWVRRFGGGVDELISVTLLFQSLLLLVIGCSGVLG